MTGNPEVIDSPVGVALVRYVHGQERAAWMVVLKIDPRFDTMRSDPNLQDLLRRMNFPS